MQILKTLLLSIFHNLQSVLDFFVFCLYLAIYSFLLHFVVRSRVCTLCIVRECGLRKRRERECIERHRLIYATQFFSVRSLIVVFWSIYVSVLSSEPSFGCKNGIRWSRLLLQKCMYVRFCSTFTCFLLFSLSVCVCLSLALTLTMLRTI